MEVIIRFCKLQYRDETSIQSHPKCVVGIEVTREVIRGITGDTAGDWGLGEDSGKDINDHKAQNEEVNL